MDSLLKIKGFLPYIAMIFLNAFVDLGHKITVQNTVFKTYDGDALILLTAIVNALILLPFALLFTPSGYLSDKYPKHRVMRVTAWGAVGLTGMITLFYHLGWFWAAFAMTLLLAVQSAFYSPAKYGYIREIAGKERLARANGMAQATTTIAILAGTFLFSVLFELHLAGTAYANERDILQTIAPIGWFLMAGAVLELCLAYRLPATSQTDEAMRFDWRKYRTGHYLRTNLRTVKSSETIFLSIIGLALFWSIGQVLLAAFPSFAKENLGVLDARVVQGMLACAGIGIMLGSIIAGRVSKNYIETGLIPIGSIGVAICLFILPGLNSPLAHGVNILLLGLLGGMFIIPLNALIQYHAGEHIIGRVLAGNNLFQNTVMLSFLALTVAFSLLEISHLLFPLLTVVALAGASYTVFKLPQSVVRFIVAIGARRRCQLEVSGFRNIPETGGVLMVGNPGTGLDWAFAQIASPRPLRFVLDQTRSRQWRLRKFLDFIGAIPVSGADDKAAVAAIAALIKKGEAVCLFPEDFPGRSGQLEALQRAGANEAQAVADAGTGVILPFHLQDLAPDQGGAGKAKVAVAFGEPLPMDTGADELQRRIQALATAS